MKKVHIQLSKKSFEELMKLNRKINKDTQDQFKVKIYSYKEYLKREKENPTMALFG